MPVQTVEPAAEKALRRWAELSSSRRTGAPIRNSFIDPFGDDWDAAVPADPVELSRVTHRHLGDPIRTPLHALAIGRGGQGGAARLKVYLSLVLRVGSSTNPTVAFEPVDMAMMLGLTDPATNGRNCVRDAMGWLKERGLVRRVGSWEYQLLDERAPGGDAVYSMPKGPKGGPDDLYARLPIGVWKNLWLPHLSAPAICVYLILDRLHRGRRRMLDGRVVVTKRERNKRFSLSDEAWLVAREELKILGVVTTDHFVEWSPRGTHHSKDAARAYTLNEAAFQQPPPANALELLEEQRRVRRRSK